jgi:hypothetical protein
MASNNKTTKLTKAHRKEILLKIAKKTHEYGMVGKQNRKTLEKNLGKSTERYNALKSQLDKAEAEVSNLQKFIDETREEVKLARKDIMNCHDIMRNMDFAGASEVKIGKDDGDVAYACDGKWVIFDLEAGTKTPYSLWKKEKSSKKNEEKNEEKESDESKEEDESNDVSDANDFAEADDADGIDIKV